MSVLNQMRTIRHYLNFIISHRYASSKNSIPKLSFRETNRELVRRVRDKKLERILKAEQNSKQNEEDEQANSNKADFTKELDSIVISKYFRQNLDKFSDVYPDVVEELKKHTNPTPSVTSTKKEDKTKEPTQYPFKKLTSVTLDSSFISEPKNDEKRLTTTSSKNVVSPDRGFFVYREDFKDEYIEGTALTLPQDREFAVIPYKELKPGAPVTFRKRFGPTDAVEEIEFQLPYQRAKHSISSETSYEDDWTLRYGVANPKIAPADANCPACGAQFHCQNSSLPGFLPYEYFVECVEKKFRDAICRRCYLLKTHNFLINVNVSDVDYVDMLSRLRKIQEVLIILIVDMLDFPCSIYKNLPDLIGYDKHVIVVGNKVDLLPPDLMDDYLDHYKSCLRQSLKDLGFDEKLNIIKTFLISAKTGYNIEQLVTYIQTHWQNKGDIYLVGCTNSGKSTLFNSFIQSDLCKIRAVDLVERATTSIWPGTTLSLLKFPIMNPTPFKLKQRERRLLMWEQQINEEERHRQNLLEETGDPQYAVLQGYIGRTFEVEEDVDLKQPTSSLFMLPEVPKKKKSDIDLNNDVFKYGKWCFDTPGTINSDQLINILTLDELTKTIPASLLVPRTIILMKGQTLLIAGLARVDFLGPITEIFLTVFASERLPLNVTERNETTEFIEKYHRTSVIGVPCGDDARLRDFPLLESKKLTVQGIGLFESCADILLSSIGWVAVTAATNKLAGLEVWTPSRRGIHVRQPSLLPFAIQRKGGRIAGTNEYKVKPIFSQAENE